MSVSSKNVNTKNAGSAGGGGALRARGSLWFAAALAGGVLIVYAQALWFPFLTLDDPGYSWGNPHIQSGLTLENVGWSFTHVYDSNWIPLTWISLMVDAQMHGLNAGGFHLTNVLLHTANTLLLFAILALATQERGKSAVVAALFALHPLHVESVAWIAERKDVLSVFFGLLSLLAYVRYATGAGRGFIASIVFFALSLMSKQTLVTLPFLLLLLDFWPLRRLSLEGMGWARASATSPAAVDPRKRNSRKRGSGKDDSRDNRPVVQSVSAARVVAEKLAFFAAAAIFSGIAVWAQSSSGAAQSLGAFPLSVRVTNAIVVYVKYLWKTIYPQDLAIYYPHPGFAIDWPLVAGAAAVLLSISAATIVLIRRYPFLFVGWFWYLGTLVPLIGIVQIGNQEMADRYTYFPLIGVFMGLAWLVPALVPAGPLRERLLPYAVVACIVLLGATTYSQASYWRDNVTLMRHSMECTPETPVAHEYLAGALMAAGSDEEAIPELRACIRMSPRFVPVRQSLAAALLRLGRFDEAIEEYRAAAKISEHPARAHRDLGALLIRLQRYHDARVELERALELDAGDPITHAHMALLGCQMKDYAAAIEHAERALALDPSMLNCHLYVALALSDQGRTDEAIARLRHLLDLAPDDKLAREQLERVLALKAGTSTK